MEQQFLQLRKEAGECYRSLLHNLVGIDWDGLAGSGKIILQDKGADE